MIDEAAAPILVVFDTRCVLCNAWVRFLLRYEANDRIRFVGAWTPTGTAIAARHELGPQDLHRTFLVVEGDRGLIRSDAGLTLLRQLKAPWRWLHVLRIVPRPVRDTLYTLVARNRYRWFGTTTICTVPTAMQRDRFTLE